MVPECQVPISLALASHRSVSKLPVAVPTVMSFDDCPQAARMSRKMAGHSRMEM